MKNADKPAYPVESQSQSEHYHGLTKREMFAMAAMQGIVAKHGLPKSWNDEELPTKVQSVVIASVVMADELLKQLDS